jgi:hypothetical protein
MILPAWPTDMRASCFLKRMTDERCGRIAAASLATLRNKLTHLSETEREIVRQLVDGMLPEHRK